MLDRLPKGVSAPRAEPKDRSRISTLDFLLMMFGSMLAVYSAGESVAQPQVGWFFVRLVCFGCVVSYVIRQLAGKSKFIRIDGVLYTLLAIYATFNVNSLNTLLPGEPFPRELQAAAYLSWMLTLGSFVAWRDGTLLFQAVPAMALFGLVGCYDTFRDVTFAFFGFLLCLATLFSRANGRDMLKLVIDSGYAGRADALNADREKIRQDQALYERVRQGPWRWIAGPEWALLTAFIVVLLSLLGAPVVQLTVQAATGGVKINLAPPPLRRAAAPAPVDQDLQLVGRGPNTGLSARPLYEVITKPHVDYLRIQIFSGWSGQGWRRATTSTFLDGSKYIQNPRRVQFGIRRVADTNNLPVPGEVQGWNDPSVIDQSRAGMFRSNAASITQFAGTSLIGRDSTVTTSAANDINFGWAKDVSSISNDVAQFAQEAAAGATSEVDKAERIRAAIAGRCRYNLKAAATPSGDDPVRYFLMDSKEGYCDVFASSMVQMARAVGLPARYVQGYLPDPVNTDATGTSVILERDYHAWAEILLDGKGWTVYDATVGATEVKGGERGSDTGTDMWAPGGILRRLIDAAIVAIATFVIGAFAYLQWQGRKPRSRRSEIDRTYSDFQKSVTKLSGRRRRPAATISEFLREAVPEPLLDDALQIGRQFEAALYRDGEPEVALVASLKTDFARWSSSVKAFRRQSGRSRRVV
jgi:hypothetical protein